MTYRLGLTGSIGMGKSTAAAMFAELGHPVWDADAAVHRLYALGGAATEPVGEAFPDAITQGAVNRHLLKQSIAKDATALNRLESIVHPLVAADRQHFIAQAAEAGAPLVVLDIPLLFETGAEAMLDGVAVVSTDAATQKARVMARPGITAETLDLILSRQMPDVEKRKRADWVIPTDTLDGARAAIRAICDDILGQSDA
ncbi:dephospho-CoA kinase [Paracoccus jeotgali]|uniref:Dephospho-CoA kinase n=1 Tax=Paracoccus jeotgali TaxID=2065379 RepID=A0A2K9MHG3_9RHOB|nr:dephospho-CoA kinase [Paracoccus jeotgali]AUM75078.1 dephospho-CoA kinase [Paracoccus jeotgali]